MNGSRSQHCGTFSVSETNPTIVTRSLSLSSKEFSNVRITTISTGICIGALLFAVICQEPSPTGPDTETTDEKPFGIFRILIDQDAGSITYSGVLKDGETPESPWASAMKSGELELLVPTHPLCETSCGSNALCVADDSCAAFPDKLSAGELTISGVSLANGSSSFTSRAIGVLKVYSAAVSFADPPFGANDTITLSAEGDDVGAFELKTYGVEPIVVLTDSIVLEEGKPINLSWAPPSVSGTTVMNVEVDISYHGGTKAKIAGNCSDDGSLTIPADMLVALKGYGLSGFPKITMTRRSASGVSAESRAQLLIESVKVLNINIPGLISCNPGNTDGCPDGMTCTDDRRCEKITDAE